MEWRPNVAKPIHHSEYTGICPPPDFQLQGGLAIGGHVAEQVESLDGFGSLAAGLALVQVVVEVRVGA